MREPAADFALGLRTPRRPRAVTRPSRRIRKERPMRQRWIVLSGLALLAATVWSPLAGAAGPSTPNRLLLERADSARNHWETSCQFEGGSTSCSQSPIFQLSIRIPSGAERVLLVAHLALQYRVSKGDVASVSLHAIRSDRPSHPSERMRPAEYLVSSADPAMASTGGFEWTLPLEGAGGRTYVLVVSAAPRDRNESGAASIRGGPVSGDVQVLAPAE